MGRHIQTAVERVARVLVGQSNSRKRGRKPKEIETSCPLEVVAFNRGSFEIALDLPRGKFESMDTGVQAIEKLIEGLQTLGSDGEVLPVGFDIGVLHSLRDMGRILGRGITSIELEPRTQRLHQSFCFNSNIMTKVTSRILGPVTSSRTIEGRLLMADFRTAAERCRIHPPVGEPIVCQFDETLEDTVYEHLRTYVKVTGETREDPVTGRITSVIIKDLEPFTMETLDFEQFTADDFWVNMSLEQLANEQGVSSVERFEDIFGKGSELWSDEEDFDAYLKAIDGIGGN